MAFKEGFVHLFKLSLRKDIFQLSQGAYALFELVLNSFILLFPVKVSSMLIPIYFIFSAFLITALLRTRFDNSLPTLFNFLLWLTTINSLLLAFKLSLLILIQFDIFSSSFFTFVIRSLRFSDAMVTHVSSAYIFGVMYSKHFSKSLAYNKNSKGPKHEPCGIPHFKISLLELAPSL